MIKSNKNWSIKSGYREAIWVKMEKNGIIATKMS